MSRPHAYHHMCGCASCCRVERMAERDEAAAEMCRDALIRCRDFIAELALEPAEAAEMAVALADEDHAEAGRILVRALYRTADEEIARRVDGDGLTPGEAAERLFYIYRDTPSLLDIAARDARVSAA